MHKEDLNNSLDKELNKTNAQPEQSIQQDQPPAELDKAQSEEQQAQDKAQLSEEQQAELDELTRDLLRCITVQMDYNKAIGYCAEQNGARLIHSVTLSADFDINLSVQITSSPEFFTPIDISAVSLASGESVSLEVPKPQLSGEFFAKLTEKERGYIIVSVRSGLVSVETKFPTQLLAFDDYAGEGSAMHHLASFSLPNNPATQRVLAMVAEQLKKQGIMLRGYQDPPETIAKQIAALYSVLDSMNLSYVLPPPSFEINGQKIRMPHTIEQYRMGTCLDLTLFASAIGEAMGLNPLLILYRGHIFPAFWLKDSSLTDMVCEDITQIRKRIPVGVSEILAFESTALTKNLNFMGAVNESTEYILKKSGFQFALDVKRARNAGVLPLPIRVSDTGEVTIEHTDRRVQRQQAPEVKTLDITLANRTGDRFTKWQRDLLDISLRNPLLNFKCNSSGLPLMVSNLEQLEDMLASDNTLALWHCPKEVKPPQGLCVVGADETLQTVLTADLNAKRLRTTVSEKELIKRATALFRSARTSVEETGASTLFLAVGFLKFYDTKLKKDGGSRGPYYAPIILLPIELKRASAQSGYSIVLRDDEPQINLSLIEMLESVYDIRAGGLTDLPMGETGQDVTLVLSTMRKLVMNMANWDIVHSASIGVFQFSKLVLLNDLKNREEEIRNHPVVSTMITGKLDARLANQEAQTAEVVLPLSADSTQVQAVKDAVEGKTFVLHGPPGTGKSQTITNIIVSALANGKRVLFVAEKMAALDVVKNRLSRLGLFDFCLELHSNKTNKKHVLAQFEGLTDVQTRAEVSDFEGLSSKLNMSASELDAFRAAMHTPTKSGLTVYNAINQYFTYEYHDELPEIDISAVTEGEFEVALGKLETAVVLGSELPAPCQSPFNCCNISEFKADTMQRVLIVCRELGENYEEVENALDTLADFLSIGAGVRGYTNLVNIVTSMQELKRLGSKNKLVSLFCRLGKKHKAVKRLGFLKELSSLYKREQDNFTFVLDTLSQFLRSEAVLNEILQYNDYFSNPEKYSEYQVDYPDFAFEINHTANTFKNGLAGLKDYCTYNASRKACLQHAILQPVIEMYHRGDIEGHIARVVFSKAFAKAVVDQAISSDVNLLTFTEAGFKNKLNKYVALSEISLDMAKKEVFKRLASSVPSMSKASAVTSEPGFLMRAMHSGGRGVSVRKLFTRIPTLLARSKPCMLMSPLSVAQYLPDGFEQFDIVVFDEASQILTGEAVGALSRGKNVVVVGDPKQLPPTTFFASGEDEDALEENTDLESLLDDVLTLGLPEHYLLWHYRSAHESLITFSNVNFYGAKLVTFPSPDDATTRVRFRKVNGSYDRGGSRTNESEAKEVVKELFEAISEDPSQTYGIIAFSSAQQEAIENIIDSELRRNPAIESHFTKEVEPVFVKNIENVQGDERDVIFFSVGYGKDNDGKLSLNFGPLNKQGGWRRLNVAVTRARKKMVVYSTITSDEIDLSRTESEGVSGLKEFLRYAELGTHKAKLGFGEVSVLAQRIKRKLEEHGCSVAVSVGKSANKIDVAVRGESMYNLGVMLDGETYGANLHTRDREILRETVLKGMGWKLIRIYAGQYYQNEDRVINQILTAITGEQSDDISAVLEQEQSQLRFTPLVSLDAEDVPCKPYVKVELEKNEQSTFYTPVGGQVLRGQLQQILQTESPISMAGIVKRVCEGWGFARSSPKLQQYVAEQLKQVKAYVSTTERTAFFFTSKEQADGLDYYRTGDRSYDDISKEEYAVASNYILTHSMSLEEDDLIRETARAFNIAKTAQSTARISYAVTLLVRQNKAHRQPPYIKTK